MRAVSAAAAMLAAAEAGDEKIYMTEGQRALGNLKNATRWYQHSAKLYGAEAGPRQMSACLQIVGEMGDKISKAMDPITSKKEPSPEQLQDLVATIGKSLSRAAEIGHQNHMRGMKK
jgi:hypothetical protein